MRGLIGSALLLIVVLGAGTAWSAKPVPNPSAAEDAFMAVMILWRDGDFDRMYEHSRAASHKSLPKEVFVKRMRAAPLRLQCCWQTLRNVEIRNRSAKTVNISADLGFDVVGVVKKHRGRTVPAVGSSFVRHETFSLRWSDGEWRFDLAAVLRVAEDR